MTDQNQVPQGQDQQGQPASELETRLSALQQQLDAKTKEAQANQARADRAESRLTRLPTGRTSQSPTPAERMAQQARAQTPARQAPPQQAPAPIQDAAEVIADQQRELMLLRELANRGMVMEQAAGISFETATELRMQLDLIQQQDEIRRLREQLSAPPENRSSSVRVDTGGPTRSVDETQLQQLTDLGNQARELKQKGRYQEAAWIALRRAQMDPSRRIRHLED